VEKKRGRYSRGPQRIFPQGRVGSICAARITGKRSTWGEKEGRARKKGEKGPSTKVAARSKKFCLLSCKSIGRLPHKEQRGDQRLLKGVQRIKEPVVFWNASLWIDHPISYRKIANQKKKTRQKNLEDIHEGDAEKHRPSGVGQRGRSYEEGHGARGEKK